MFQPSQPPFIYLHEAILSHVQIIKKHDFCLCDALFMGIKKNYQPGASSPLSSSIYTL